ncbi:hypothetical protein Tco_0591034 [Tanacetum coccineum]
MPLRRARNINDVYERIMARMEERLDQFVDGSSLFAEPKEWEDDGMADDDYEEASVFDDDQYKDVIEEEEIFVGKGFKNRCQFMIPILKMLLRKKKDLLGKEDLVRNKTTSKTL